MALHYCDNYLLFILFIIYFYIYFFFHSPNNASNPGREDICECRISSIFVSRRRLLRFASRRSSLYQGAFSLRVTHRVYSDAYALYSVHKVALYWAVKLETLSFSVVIITEFIMSCFRKPTSMFLVLWKLTHNFVGCDRGQTSVEITTRWSEIISGRTVMFDTI